MDYATCYTFAFPPSQCLCVDVYTVHKDLRFLLCRCEVWRKSIQAAFKTSRLICPDCHDFGRNIFSLNISPWQYCKFTYRGGKVSDVEID